jgi:dimethylargininase
MLTRVIVCPPGPEYFNVRHRKSHNIERPADERKAKRQHDDLRSLLQRSGCKVIDVPELEGHPNSVFTMDTALCTPFGFITLRMGLDTRRGEETWMENILTSLGEKQAGKIESPGTVEGGDVILTGSIAFIGLSQRTNKEGAKQVSALLASMNYEIRMATVPSPYLHLGGAMSILGRQRVLCCEGIFPHGFFNGFETVEVPGGSFIGGNVIYLGNNEVIADRSNDRSIDKLRTAGIQVHPLDLSEFIKGTGGPSCLVLPV